MKSPIAKALTTPRVFLSMNQTERAYADQLELLRRAGQILRWDFEPERLKLADATFYVPDFRVVYPDGRVEFHEVKGYMRDDAAVKIKVAASVHPYTFVLVRKTKHGFTLEPM